MKRRDVLRTAGGGAALFAAGCLGTSGGGGDGGDGGDGGGGGGTTAAGPTNYGLPTCDDADVPIQISEATLELDEENERAVVTLNYEFVSGQGTAETPQRAVTVSFFVTVFDSDGEKIGTIAGSRYVGTEGQLERELVYDGTGWENAASFSLTLDPEACA